MVKHRKSATVGHLAPVDHDTLGTQTPLHSQLLVLTLDSVNHIAAEKHLHLCESVLEKLRLLDLHLVAEEVDEHVVDRLEKLHVIQVDYIAIDAVSKKIITNGTRGPKQGVVENLEELGRVAFFCPIIE